MSERTNYVPGTPCWVDLATPDIEAAERFYGELFGWEIPELPDSAEMGGYRRAKLDGRDVAGVMPLMQEGQPPAWSTYVSVDDAEAIGRAVQENGGTMIAEPMEVSNYGRLALFTDPEGAFFGIWEPADFAGAELVNEPGAFSWNELGTRDPSAAKAFYAAIFGWGFRDNDMGEMGTYIEWLNGEDSIGGMLDIRGRLPDEIPAHWLVYFVVEDTDATIETVKSASGNVPFGPVDIPAGRFAVAADPWGAAFAVIQLSEETVTKAP
ncbi:MAG TPA: VOC family protein [Solirubrobacterales bacterium]|jgi:predicted enzyme related to lactoylglutathione lyase|nr:VOC family protein [Solirubrobacterales bacterium]